MEQQSACLLVDNGKILLNRNLDLPTTKINEGETTEQAATRIAKQIGIDAEIDRFFSLNFFAKNQVYTYLCKIKSTNMLSNEYEWFSYDDIENKELSENVEVIIDKIKMIL